MEDVNTSLEEIFNTLFPTDGLEPEGFCIDARKLHQALESRQDFSTWIKSRIKRLRLIEGFDYQVEQTRSGTVPLKNGTVLARVREGVRVAIDYSLTLHTAKEISMMESTDAGYRVRCYFIECEKKLQQVLKPKEQCFLDILRSEDDVDRVLAIRKLDQTVIKPLEVKVEYQAKELEVKERVIEEAKPKVSYYDIILQSQDLMSITEIAKDYGISAARLNKILESESVQYKYYKDWNFYHHYKTQGLTATTTHKVKQGYVKTILKWNQKGRLFIHDLLKSLNIFATMDEEKIPSEPLSHKSFRYIYRNTKSDKPFEKWVDEYRKDLVPKKD